MPQRRSSSPGTQPDDVFAQLYEAAPDAMLLIRDDGTIVRINARTKELFGWGDDLVGQPVEALVPERLRDAHVLDRRSYFRTPSVRGMERGASLVGLRRDGSEFPVEIRISPIRMGEAVFAVAAVRDISDRLRIEEERRRLALVEDALRMHDEFLSIASHELRTPLTGLKLQLVAIARGLDEPGPDIDRLRERVNRARRQVRHLADLVTTLLDASAAAETPARVSLERTPVDLATIARAVVEDFEETARAAGCSVVMHADTEVLGDWDRFRIEQVLLNLLSNAAKYGAGQPIEVRVEAQGDLARLVVRDRGIGIAPEDLTRIFERYEQAVSPRRYGGLGLGLFIARNNVEAHGGRIRVESEPGRGATFVVELPRSAR